jgi:hypothetical protein
MRCASSASLPRCRTSSPNRGLRGGVHAAEERRDAGEQVRQAHVLGEVVVRAQAKPRHDVEIGITRRKKDDRQARARRAQLAAQVEAAIHVRAQPDVDDGELGKARRERLRGAGAVAERGHVVAGPREGIDVVLPDGVVVLDEGDAAGHGVNYGARRSASAAGFLPAQE